MNKKPPASKKPEIDPVDLRAAAIGELSAALEEAKNIMIEVLNTSRIVATSADRTELAFDLLDRGAGIFAPSEWLPAADKAVLAEGRSIFVTALNNSAETARGFGNITTCDDVIAVFDRLYDETYAEIEFAAVQFKAAAEAANKIFGHCLSTEGVSPVFEIYDRAFGGK